MWDQFSFFGMRALLVLYMTKHLLMAQSKASWIYGVYAATFYLTPVFGGIITDRWLTRRASVILGGVIMAHTFPSVIKEGLAMAGLPMGLLRVLLEETEFEAGFYVKAALSAQAIRQLNCTKALARNCAQQIQIQLALCKVPRIDHEPRICPIGATNDRPRVFQIRQPQDRNELEVDKYARCSDAIAKSGEPFHQHFLRHVANFKAREGKDRLYLQSLAHGEAIVGADIESRA